MANELFYSSPGSSSAPGRLQPVLVIEPVLTHLSTSRANPREGGRGCPPARGPAAAGAPVTARLSAPEPLTVIPGAQAPSPSSSAMLQASELRVLPLK